MPNVTRDQKLLTDAAGGTGELVGGGATTGVGEARGSAVANAPAEAVEGAAELVADSLPQPASTADTSARAMTRDASGEWREPGATNAWYGLASKPVDWTFVAKMQAHRYRYG